jgi:tetratricopeptide (TPR) repeat protein
MGHGRLVLLTATAALFLGGAVGAQPAVENYPYHRVLFGSRESEAGPRLVVTADDGSMKTLSPTADAVIAPGSPRTPAGDIGVMIVGLGDAYRGLLRFDSHAGGVKSAELILKLRRSPYPPNKPFELGVYELRKAWDEKRVVWAGAPAATDTPGATAAVEPKADEVRIDVTALVRRMAEAEEARHGWLLKVVEPAQMPPMPEGARGPRAELLKVVPWAESTDAAFEQARKDNKLVLACVRAAYNPQAESLPEQLLLTTVLADPDVAALVRSRFVPVRVSYPATVYIGRGAPNWDDPLEPFGTTSTETKALAIVVSTADGTMVAKLENIGTFDRDMVLRFLFGTLPNDDAKDDHPLALVAAGRLDRATESFKARGGRESEYGLCKVASLRGDYAEALRRAEPLGREDGAYRHEARYEAAFALMRLGRFDDAKAAFREVGDGLRAPEAGYYRGCLLDRAGNATEARKTWQEVVARHPGTPAAARSKARLTWTGFVAMFENLTPAGPASAGRTEADFTGRQDELVRRALEYLLAQQRSDGGWSSGHMEIWRSAVTALVARSLHLWGRRLDDDLGRRCVGAAEKATRHLDAVVAKVRPDTMDTFGATYLLDYFLDLEATDAKVLGGTAAAVKLLVAAQCRHGGWSYNLRFAEDWNGGIGSWPITDQGREHSMNTGPALLALARAKARGQDVPAGVLTRGSQALLAMRDRPGVFTYLHPVPRSFNTPDQSIGRACSCEHPLMLLGATKKGDVGTAIELFLKYRDDLRTPVKLTEAWVGPRRASSYFYFFAYDHAARAIIDHGADVPQRLATLRDDVLRVAEADGTWVDFETIGKPYGTAMALHVLYLARGAGAN